MLQLLFSVLKKNYPPKQLVKTPELFKEIGWDDLIDNPTYENTCAIRLSLALIKSGVRLPEARMSINAGPYKNRRIEPGQGKLSLILARKAMLGTPEKFKAGTHEKGIGNRSGIVSFFSLIPGVYEQGHIDIVSFSDGGARKCGSECYWASKEVWFWPLR